MDVLKEIPRLTFYRGRVGLYAILRALGIGPGDEVATQAFTCVAVPEGIMATGAKTLFVDTEEGGVNICPLQLEARLTPQTKAVVVQHTFGIPAQLSEIRSILEPRGIPIVEDCCHTFASTYVNQVVGTFGVGAFYSFEWGKPIVTGIGGSAVLIDQELRKKVQEIWNGMHEPSIKSLIKIQLQYSVFKRMYKPSNYWKLRAARNRLSKSGAVTGNYNPTGEVAEDFSLHMAKHLRRRLVRQLAKTGGIVNTAKKIVTAYESGLSSQWFQRPFVPEGGAPVYARYPLLCNDKERLLARAEEERIEVADWYRTPVHPIEMPDWRSVHLEQGSCPRAEALCSQIVSLPVNQKVTDDDIKRTLELLADF